MFCRLPAWGLNMCGCFEPRGKDGDTKVDYVIDEAVEMGSSVHQQGARALHGRRLGLIHVFTFGELVAEDFAPFLDAVGSGVGIDRFVDPLPVLVHEVPEIGVLSVVP